MTLLSNSQTNKFIEKHLFYIQGRELWGIKARQPDNKEKHRTEKTGKLREREIARVLPSISQVCPWWAGLVGST